MSGTKKITYNKIVELTGISASTISRTIKNPKIVKAETRDLIFKAMEELGMETQEYKSQLEKGNESLIIFFVPSLDNPFYSQVIKGAKASAERNHYDLMVNEGHINERTVEDVILLAKRTKAAGIITTNNIAPSIAKKLNQEIPFIQCCECNPGLGIPFVTIDDVSAARKAIEYLIKIGKKKIAFINGPIRYKYAQDRKKGYMQALQDAKISIDQRYILQLDSVNYEMAVAAASQLFYSNNPPDAFFTISDVYAAAAIKAALRAGLRVPQDVSVIGFDNVEISTMYSPAITTISQPQYQLGYLASEMLSKVIRGEEIVKQELFLETELIVRESTV
ncbi:MAG: substrate-binding domain-containing protein [Spirochaetales bacterium]|nr:substrate-binding domain-containing protein [Spirochaetales bacterium]